MTQSRHFLGFNERTIATLVIAIAASVFASLVTATIVNQRFNDSQSRQQAAYRADQDKRQAQYRKQLAAKTNQTLKISSAQFSFAINSNACGFERYGQAAIDRAKKARDDPRSDPRVITAAKATIAQTRSFLRTNAVKVPSDFDCATLPKKAPTP